MIQINLKRAHESVYEVNQSFSRAYYSPQILYSVGRSNFEGIARFSQSGFEAVGNSTNQVVRSGISEVLLICEHKLN